MLGNQKNVFWEALLLAGVIFVFGLLIGIAYENSKADEINEYYINSEISLMDIVAMNNLVELGNSDCGALINANLDFADRIYIEALLLEEYESAGKITEGMKLIHKKYDLMRTFLWINSMKISDKCGDNFSVVVYLYEYETEDLNKKAIQNVWSKILMELKHQEGENLILIPIAVDNNLIALQSLVGDYKLFSFPVVIINNQVVSSLSSVEDLKSYLK